MSFMSPISFCPNRRRQELIELMGEVKYTEIVGRFLNDATRFLRKLETTPLPDLREIVAECHNLCGAAYMIGHDECAERFASIERAAKAGDMVAAWKLVAELRASHRSMAERVSQALHFVA